MTDGIIQELKAQFAFLSQKFLREKLQKTKEGDVPIADQQVLFQFCYYITSFSQVLQKSDLSQDSVFK
jgi:hypothetical protein